MCITLVLTSMTIVDNNKVFYIGNIIDYRYTHLFNIFLKFVEKRYGQCELFERDESWKEIKSLTFSLC